MTALMLRYLLLFGTISGSNLWLACSINASTCMPQSLDVKRCASLGNWQVAGLATFRPQKSALCITAARVPITYLTGWQFADELVCGQLNASRLVKVASQFPPRLALLSSSALTVPKQNQSTDTHTHILLALYKAIGLLASPG